MWYAKLPYLLSSYSSYYHLICHSNTCLTHMDFQITSQLVNLYCLNHWLDTEMQTILTTGPASLLNSLTSSLKPWGSDWSRFIKQQSRHEDATLAAPLNIIWWLSLLLRLEICELRSAPSIIILTLMCASPSRCKCDVLCVTWTRRPCEFNSPNMTAN